MALKLIPYLSLVFGQTGKCTDGQMATLPTTGHVVPDSNPTESRLQLMTIVHHCTKPISKGGSPICEMILINC